MVDEREETYNTLNSLLANEDSFKEVIEAVFASIDEDGSGDLQPSELEKFIKEVCTSMGLKSAPGGDNINQVFKELDKDKSGTIDKEELGAFLKSLFSQQRDELAEQLGKSK